MELPGINALKRLPLNSSSDMQAFEKMMNSLVELARAQASSLHLVVDFQELVSSARVEKAYDEIAVIRQVASALDDLRAHFRTTMADGSVELAQHHVAETLRKALRDLDQITPLVAR